MAVQKSALTLRLQWLGTVIFFVALILALPTMILLCFAGIPILVAYLVDPYKRHRYLSICVGAASMVAIIPFLLALWGGNNTLSEAMDIVSDPMVWLTILCGAAIGWLVYTIFPSLAESYITRMWQYDIDTSKQRQKELIDKWGESLGTQPQNETRDKT